MCKIIRRGHIIIILYYITLLHTLIQKQQLNVWRRGIKNEVSFFLYILPPITTLQV